MGWRHKQNISVSLNGGALWLKSGKPSPLTLKTFHSGQGWPMPLNFVLSGHLQHIPDLFFLLFVLYVVCGIATQLSFEFRRQNIPKRERCPIPKCWPVQTDFNLQIANLTLLRLTNFTKFIDFLVLKWFKKLCHCCFWYSHKLSLGCWHRNS